jgi:peptidoglycan/xylan/chitin deacetylase (PgdA/CDA1 family)
MTADLRVLTAIIVLVIAQPLTAADSAVVLMYHRFGEDSYPSTNIRVEQLEAQLEHLREGGYAVVPLADVLEFLTGGGSLPPRAVVITIDDAYRSVYDVAFPRFRAAGFPFTVFVATDPVDQGLRAYMTWDQMREMATAGATYANHGASHDSLIERQAGESDADWKSRVRADVDKGWRRLRDELDPVPGVFAYPYGEYDGAVAGTLRGMGYVAFGQQSGAVGQGSDLRALPRFPMAEAFADLAEFRTKVASRPLPVVAVEPWDPVVLTRRPRIEVTLGDADARLSDLACYVSGQGAVEVEWLTPTKRFRVGPSESFGEGRHRVNCTVPRSDGRYLWFSHPWIIQNTNERRPADQHDRR